MESSHTRSYVLYFMIGAWLLILSLGSVFFVFFTLSTYQLQEEISKIPIKKHDDGITAFRNHVCDIRALKMYKSLDEFTVVELPCLPRESEELEYYRVSDIQSRSYSKSVVEGEIKNIKGKIETLDKKHKELINNPGTTKAIDRRIVSGNLDAANKKLEGMEEDLKSLPGIKENIKSQIHDIDHYITIFSPIAKILNIDDVWALPTSMLSIFLALSMGGLGSLIFVTIEYLNCNPKECAGTDIGMYFFRPILGSLMALVMYIVVKSGQISFFGEDVTELSPFLLSFLGVASGLASESLYEKLSESIEAKVKSNGV